MVGVRDGRIFDRGRDDCDSTWHMVIQAVPDDSRAERGPAGSCPGSLNG